MLPHEHSMLRAFAHPPGRGPRVGGRHRGGNYLGWSLQQPPATTHKSFAPTATSGSVVERKGKQGVRSTLSTHRNLRPLRSCTSLVHSCCHLAHSGVLSAIARHRKTLSPGPPTPPHPTPPPTPPLQQV